MPIGITQRPTQRAEHDVRQRVHCKIQRDQLTAHRRWSERHHDVDCDDIIARQRRRHQPAQGEPLSEIVRHGVQRTDRADRSGDYEHCAPEPGPSDECRPSDRAESNADVRCDRECRGLRQREFILADEVRSDVIDKIKIVAIKQIAQQHDEIRGDAPSERGRSACTFVGGLFHPCPFACVTNNMRAKSPYCKRMQIQRVWS